MFSESLFDISSLSGDTYVYLDAYGSNWTHTWNSNNATIPTDLLSERTGDCVQLSAKAQWLTHDTYRSKPYWAGSCGLKRNVLCECKYYHN